MADSDVRPALRRPRRWRTRVGLLAIGTVLALVAGVGPTTIAVADDSVGGGDPSATSGPESPQSVQGPEPAPMVDPVQNATSSEWIVLCTSFSPCKAAGYGNDGYDGVYRSSFWSQYGGHNCTNYVAYRMIRNGMSSTRPAAISGNALNWGVALARQTNDSPAVGAVAWWDSSFSASGHVAYVERVVSSSEIYVSEDNWGGDFRWRKITRTGGRWPKGFIHLKDVAASTAASYQAITPARLVDTRSGLGASRSQVGGRSEISVQVAGRGGLPSAGVTSAVLNVTAVKAKSSGYLRVYPSGSTRPPTSNVNYRTGWTVANQVVTKVGTDGKVKVYASGTTDVVVDVAGFAQSSTGLTTVTPKRLLDTRTATGGHRAKVGGGETVGLTVTGSGGLPSSAGAALLNVTVTEPTARGYVTAWPSGGSRPPTSNINYDAGDTVAGLVLSKIGSDGRVSLRPNTDSHLIVDVVGWAPSGSNVVGLTPVRLLDTRTSSGRPAGGTSTAIKVTGRSGVPSTVKAVLLNVVMVSPSTSGVAVVYPSGVSRPGTSNVNFRAGHTIANSVMAKVGADGYVRVFTTASSHLVVDVQGYVR
ncbi:MAG: CHAP domain-containing protein [Humibacillus sp.]|nr:CHAP domain-containing protein [Humibacillus sp.]MDN5778135.1 CHAP domain-containing protein [Humibacillus sp.]